MNYILEERQNIIKNNNTAQKEFEYILDELAIKNPSTKEITVTRPLHGDLNFGVLSKKGFHNIEKIIIGDATDADGGDAGVGTGEITSIHGLPESLEVFHCNYQYLTELENLPPNLVHLECHHNYLQVLDLKHTKHLKTLNANNNELVVIENIPQTVEEIYCNSNKIRTLNLGGLLNLRILHCTKNSTIVLQNVPRTLVKLKMEAGVAVVNYETPFETAKKFDEKNKEILTQQNIIKSLHEYFNLKNKYDTAVHKMKKDAFEKSKSSREQEDGEEISGRRVRRQIAIGPAKCINCARNVGSLFLKKENRYIAKCGDTKKPCSLNIDIEMGVYSMLDKAIYMNREYLETIKTDIVKERMDRLFELPFNEKKSKELLDDYTFHNMEMTRLLELQNELYNSKFKNQQIAEKKKNIYELQDSIRDLIAEYKSGNGGDDAAHAILLESALKIQTRQLNPEIENLRLLQHEIMEMENTSYNVGGWGGGGGGGDNRDVTAGDDGGGAAAADKSTTNIKVMNRLVQYPVSLQKMEIKIN